MNFGEALFSLQHCIILRLQAQGPHFEAHCLDLTGKIGKWLLRRRFPIVLDTPWLAFFLPVFSWPSFLLLWVGNSQSVSIIFFGRYFFESAVCLPLSSITSSLCQTPTSNTHLYVQTRAYLACYRSDLPPALPPALPVSVDGMTTHYIFKWSHGVICDIFFSLASHAS